MYVPQWIWYPGARTRGVWCGTYPAVWYGVRLSEDMAQQWRVSEEMVLVHVSARIWYSYARTQGYGAVRIRRDGAVARPSEDMVLCARTQGYGAVRIRRDGAVVRPSEDMVREHVSEGVSTLSPMLYSGYLALF